MKTEVETTAMQCDCCGVAIRVLSLFMSLDSVILQRSAEIESIDVVMIGPVTHCGDQKL